MGTAKEFDLEGCLALEPDLVILPLKLQDSADTLAEMGVPTLVVNPEDQDLLNEAVTLIGEATNTSDRAAALLDFAAGQEERLAQALEGAETPSVYLAGNSDFLSTAGDAMYQADMIRMAGASTPPPGSPTPTGPRSATSRSSPGTLTTSSWRRTPPIRWTTS